MLKGHAIITGGRKLASYKNASGEPCFAPDQEDLKRALITQFYEDSVLRYGPDSEGARTLSKFLGPEIRRTVGDVEGPSESTADATRGLSQPDRYSRGSASVLRFASRRPYRTLTVREGTA
jgi:hypothetical protein